MFYGRPRYPEGAAMQAMPGAGPGMPGAGPGMPGVGPGMPGMGPGMPGVPPIGPSGLVTLDFDANPGLVNMDMDIGGPFAPVPHDMHYMEAGVAGGKIHVVVKGDTIWKISRMYNVDMQAILLANNLRYPDVIYPGQRLVIPDGLSYSNF